MLFIAIVVGSFCNTIACLQKIVTGN